jgi:hypothetical protein
MSSVVSAEHQPVRKGVPEPHALNPGADGAIRRGCECGARRHRSVRGARSEASPWAEASR